MKSLANFWLACEKLSATGVMKDWEMTLGNLGSLELAKALLVPLQELSSQYPCTAKPHCECVHEVAYHKDGSITACCVCDDSECDPIPVTGADLIRYQVDFPRIFKALAKAAGFNLIEVYDIDLTRPIHFGNLKRDESETVPVCFALTRRTIDSLNTSFVGKPLILFTLRTPDIYQEYESHLIIQIGDLFGISNDGRLAVSKKLRPIIANFTQKASVIANIKQMQNAASESVFMESNDYHTITIHGKTFPHLSNLQSDVVRILHKAHMSGQKEVIYNTVECELTKIHSNEIGFIAPNMSQIFRSGDTRGGIIASPKQGYYRLNI